MIRSSFLTNDLSICYQTVDTMRELQGQVQLKCHPSHERGALSTAHQSGLRIKANISSISHITRRGNRKEFPGRRIQLPTELLSAPVALDLSEWIM